MGPVEWACAVVSLEIGKIRSLAFLMLIASLYYEALNIHIINFNPAVEKY